MRIAKLTDVKNHLSKYIDQVRAGERIRILLRGVPVADLVPVDEPEISDADLERKLADLERKGMLRRGHSSIDDALFEPGPAAPGKPLSEYVIEERRSRR